MYIWVCCFLPMSYGSYDEKNNGVLRIYLNDEANFVFKKSAYF